MTPRPASADELDQVIELIAGEQQQPSRHIAYLGTDPTGIRKELEELVPCWTDTLRIVSSGGTATGAAYVESDEEIEQAWIHGPWVIGADSAWDELAPQLLAAAIEQVPGGIGRIELAGDVQNVRLATLAIGLGWHEGIVNHALVVDGGTASCWPPCENDDVRPARAGDGERLAPLHDAEFPGTYMSAGQLERRALGGESVMLVSTTPDGTVVAYATGQVQPDGEGFIDFVAVKSQARNRGLGRRLVMTLSRALLAEASQRRVCLTVQEPRVAARSLYADLGFRADGSLIAYRTERRL